MGESEPDGSKPQARLTSAGLRRIMMAAESSYEAGRVRSSRCKSIVAFCDARKVPSPQTLALLRA